MTEGIKFPLKFHGGRLSTSKDDDHIKQSIQQILTTRKGEYMLLPEFGCDIHDRVFDPAHTVALVNLDIRTALKEFEHRIRVNGVTSQPGQDGVIVIDVSYTILSNGEEVSLEINLRS